MVKSNLGKRYTRHKTYKTGRAKGRSAYETYSQWYDKLSKKNPDMFYEKLSEKEFTKQYDLSKKAKMANPAKAVAQSQRKYDYFFVKNYEKETKNKLTGNETKEQRKQIFDDFAKDYDGDYKAAREDFEALY